MAADLGLRTLRKAAVDLGMSVDTVRRWVKEMGLQPRFGTYLLSEEDMDRLRQRTRRNAGWPRVQAEWCPECQGRGKLSYLRQSGELTWCELCAYEPPESERVPVTPPRDYQETED